MVRVKLRCIMGCPGLKSSYREKVYYMSGLFCIPDLSKVGRKKEFQAINIKLNKNKIFSYKC